MKPVPYISFAPATTKAAPPPYQSQQGNGVYNDCGPAAALMLARWVGKGLNDSVAYWAKRIDAPQDGTTPQDLAGMLKALGLTPLIGMATPLPRIELVRYNKLPHQNPDYEGDTFLHWIVRLSETSWHDPLWNGTAGANLTATKAEIDAANAGFTNSVGMVERPQEVTMAEPARVKYDRVYHVINAGATEDEAVKIFRDAFRNNRQTVGFSYDDAGIGDGLQSKRAVLHGIKEADRAAFVNFYRQYYPSVIVEFAAAVTPPVPPPPVVDPPKPTGTAIGVHPALPLLPFNKRLGVHTLERIEEAREAFNLGCRSFTIMNNHAGAREMRAKGAAVIVRMFMNHGVVVPPEEFARYYGVNADDTLICMGINEADNISTSEIEKRFDWDRRWALEMHRLYPRCFIVIGSFSMGTPQIDNPEVAARFKNTYSAFLNANADWCGLNYHSYQRRHSSSVPPASQAVEDPAWWPKRFLLWGYNAGAGGLNTNVVMVSDEAGVDIGGIGGFPACGYDDNTFMRWWEMHRAWFEPVPQVYCQNIFQLSPRADWAGYNARVVLGGLAQVWQGTAPALRNVAQPEVYEGEAPGADWNPPAKDLSVK